MEWGGFDRLDLLCHLDKIGGENWIRVPNTWEVERLSNCICLDDLFDECFLESHERRYFLDCHWDLVPRVGDVVNG